MKPELMTLHLVYSFWRLSPVFFIISIVHFRFPSHYFSWSSLHIVCVVRIRQFTKFKLQTLAGIERRAGVKLKFKFFSVSFHYATLLLLLAGLIATILMPRKFILVFFLVSRIWRYWNCIMKRMNNRNMCK